MMKKLLLTIILLTVPLTTHAYFSDTQTSVATMSAGRIAFTMSATTTDIILGAASFTFAINDESTQSPQYTFSVVSSTCGTAAFQFDVTSFSGEHTVTASEVTSPCELTILAEAWQQNFTYNQGGFTSSSVLTFTFTNSIEPQPTATIILNEIFPHPTSNASSPLTIEWIELYNSTSEEIDAAGWSIAEESGTNINHHEIVSICPTSKVSKYMSPVIGTDTTINAGDVKAFKFCGSASYLNQGNSGETVYLHVNSTSASVSSYTYTTSTEGTSFAWNGSKWIVNAVPTPNTENFPVTSSVAQIVTTLSFGDSELTILISNEENEVKKEEAPDVESGKEEELVTEPNTVEEEAVGVVIEDKVEDQVEDIVLEESEEDVLETEPVPEPEPEEPEPASEVSTDINPEEL